MTHPHAQSRALISLQNAAQLAKQSNEARQLAWVGLYLASISGSPRMLETYSTAYIAAQNNYAKRKAAYAKAWDKYTMGARHE